MKKRFKLTALVLLTVGLVSVDLLRIDRKPAYGCSCVRPESASVARDRTTAVFSGTVNDITPREQNGYGTYTVEFSVDEQWKGEAANTLKVQTAGNSAACGYSFKVGEAYLVYAYESGAYPQTEEGTLSVGLCGRTRLLTDATEDIAELNGLPMMPSTGNAEGTRGGCQ